MTSCQSSWSTIPSPNPGVDSGFNGTATIGVNDIWAVGDASTAGGVFQTTTEHWDGNAWSTVPSPNTNAGTGDNLLAAVAAVSTSDAWVVGISVPDQTVGTPRSTLTEHWNGSAWSIVASPNVAGRSNSLFSVKGDASNDFWAVGRSLVTNTSDQTLAEHWNGTSWSITATPSPATYSELIAVTVLSPTNVWAVGDQSADAVNFTTLIEHWDGVSWSVVPSAQSSLGNGFLLGVSGTANDLWAVGASLLTGVDVTLVEHWNGSTWATVPNVPSNANTDLNAVAAISATNVWAVGTTFSGTRQAPTDQAFVAHWDGNTWSQVTAVNPGVSNDLNDVASVGGSDVWAAGADLSTAYSTLAENYCVPPTVTSINPTSGPTAGGTSVTITGTGLVWTTGVNFGSTASPSAVAGSDTQATAVSPAGAAGVVDVRVVFFAGSSAPTAGDQFTYVVLLPGAPTGVSATPGNASATVSWSAPSSNGGGAIDSYVVTPYIGATAQTSSTVSGSPPATSTVITGLSNGTTYTFKVAAHNSAGLGPASAPSNPVTPYTVAGAPGSVHALPGETEATITWTPPVSNGGSPITGYVVTASPGGASTVVSTVAPAATITGLTNGTPYTFTVAARNAAGDSTASSPSAAVTPVVVAKGPAVAVLPAMTSGAYGGYLTVAYLENFSPATAHIRVQYFDQHGNPVGIGNSAAALPFWGTWTLRQDNADALAAGQAGSAVVYSDQPLAVFVNEFAPGAGDASSYTSIKIPGGAGATLYAPAIANGAYGGYTTGLGLINAGTAPTNVRITYRDGSGAAIRVQNLTGIAANAYQALYSGDAALALPAGFAGTATIESTSTPAQPLAAVVNEVGPGGQFSSYDALPSGSTTLDAPVALNNAFGGYYTGMGIQNTTAGSGTVTLKYYDGAGTLVKTVSNQAIAGRGYLGVYQGDAALGPPASASGYTAVLTSTVPIAVIVNEVASGASQSSSYNTFAAGSTTANLALVESGGADGWSTGLGIMNTGTSSTVATVTYFDAATGQFIGSVVSPTLAPNAFWGAYQPAANLPAGDRASAQVTTSGGTVAVICNETNATSFMSYDGQ